MSQSGITDKMLSIKDRTFWLEIITWIMLLCSFSPGIYAASLEENYVGCYKLGNLVPVANSSSTTIESCIASCQRNNNTYAALQGGNICACLDAVNTSFQSNDCNNTCNGDQYKLCGGRGGRYSIYTVCPIGRYGIDCKMACHCDQQIPCDRISGYCPNNKCYGNWTGTSCNIINASSTYLGCYSDDYWNRVLPQSGEGGQLKCSMNCSQSNCTYFGLEYGGQCFCGNSCDSSRRISESSCNYPCDDNSKEICGGYYTISVYSVCPVGNYGDNCYARCNCLSNASCSYSNGACPLGGCKPGWSGSSCNIRDCQKYNGSCPANQACLQLDLNYASVTRCMCPSGYQRNNLWDFCTDMDECSFDEPVCNASNSNCINTVGSFLCVCKKGYKSLSSTVCTDVDECATKEAICNNTISNCVNTDGSYYCSCKDGYKSFNDTFCEDKDECNNGESKCDANSTTCINTVGSYNCTCRPGFQYLDAFNCSDIDECLAGTYTCDNLTTTCTNSIGSYICMCRAGLEKKTDITCSRAVTGIPSGTIAGAVVGSVLGVIVIVGLVFLLLFIIRRRRTNKEVVDRPPLIDEVDSKASSIDLSRRGVLSLYADKSGPLPTSTALNIVRDKLSDRKALQEEFQSVALKTGEFSALGSREELKKKNRFINIIPYDKNRVMLSRTTDDDSSQYINASYVQGYNESDTFIAAQGPRKESVDDFWRMIVEKKITLIVMITNLVENQKKKCEKYWPELDETVTYDDVSVTLLEEHVWPNYTVRNIRASVDNESMDITQWHYEVWPDHGVPTDAKCFLNFHAKVRRQMAPDSYTLVHCSAGAGRTGAFLAIDYLLEQEKEEHTVDILECLKKLRDDRPSMIQALPQYEFVHLALLKAFMLGETTIPTKNFASQHQSWKTRNSTTAGKTLLEIQFQDIEETKTSEDEAGRYRVLSNSVEQSKIDEIDAVFVNSWRRVDAFIWTKLLDDQESFWMLRKEKESKIIIYIESSEDSSINFLPSQESSIHLKGSVLLMDSETKEKYGTRCLISEAIELPENNYANTASEAVYENTTKNYSNRSQISVLRLKEPSGGKWSNVDSLRSLFSFLESSRTTKRRTDFPVMITSRSECCVAGFLISMLNAIEMMKLEKEVDLYQVVLNIRKSKPEFISSLSSYSDLHDVVERYLKTSAA